MIFYLTDLAGYGFLLAIFFICLSILCDQLTKTRSLKEKYLPLTIREGQSFVITNQSYQVDLKAGSKAYFVLVENDDHKNPIDSVLSPTKFPGEKGLHVVQYTTQGQYFKLKTARKPVHIVLISEQEMTVKVLSSSQMNINKWLCLYFLYWLFFIILLNIFL